MLSEGQAADGPNRGSAEAPATSFPSPSPTQLRFRRAPARPLGFSGALGRSESRLFQEYPPSLEAPCAVAPPKVSVGQRHRPGSERRPCTWPQALCKTELLLLKTPCPALPPTPGLQPYLGGRGPHSGGPGMKGSTFEVPGSLCPARMVRRGLPAPPPGRPRVLRQTLWTDSGLEGGVISNQWCWAQALVFPTLDSSCFSWRHAARPGHGLRPGLGIVLARPAEQPSGAACSDFHAV